MSEEQNVPPQANEPSGSQADNSWREVGKQFETLGETLAQTVRSAWQNEENQKRLQELRTGLESMVRDVGRAIDDSMSTPQGQKIRADAGRAAESLRNAGEQTVQEVRPQLINALEQVNNELQKLINRMEKPNPPEEGSGPADQA